jgi:hypothetical protein
VGSDGRRAPQLRRGQRAPFTLTASILGATVDPNPDVIASATLGVPVARSYDITNVFGAFTGRAVGTALGSAFLATPTIANHAQQVTFVTVAAGSTSLRATIGSPLIRPLTSTCSSSTARAALCSGRLQMPTATPKNR